jgi:hypothetical protein
VAEKPTPGVVGLVHRDPVDPGFQTALTAETANIAEDLEENFLNHIVRIARICHEAVNQVINGLLKRSDQKLVGFLGPLPEGARQPGIRPGSGFCTGFR